MDLKTYKKISSRWRGKRYQTWDKVSTRLKLLNKVMGDLKGRSFLEIGANAGIVSCEVAPFVSKYVGVEDDLLFYRQALSSRRYAKRHGDVAFYHKTFGEFAHRCEEKFDIIYTSNVLYYLREGELEALKRDFLPYCTLMINIFRARKTKTGRNKYRLYTCKKIANYFTEFNFEVHKGSVRDLYMMVGKNEIIRRS